MKKILFVMHSLDFGGAERALVNLLCELPKDRYEVDVLLFQRKGELMKQLPQWVRVLDTPECLAGLYAPVKDAGAYRWAKLVGTLLARLVRRTRKSRSAWRWRNVYSKRVRMLPGHYDTAVAFTGSEILYYVTDRVSASRKIVFIHNDYETAGYSAEDDAPYLSKMNAIVSISPQCVDVLKRVFPQDADRICCLENITSSALVRQRAQEAAAPEYDPDGVNILSVGRLWPQKGFDFAIDAAALLRDRGIETKWFVVGEGSLRPELEKQIAAHSLEDRFFLLGTRSNPYPYMKHCTLLVQPSRYEGKSVVLDEAKMLCVPIVASAYPTVADQVEHGVEGLVVPMNAAGIADGVEQMLKEQELRGQIIANLASKEYGNQQEVIKYMQLLDEDA